MYIIMKKLILSLCLATFLPLAVLASDVLVTRNFSGAWDQPEQESQGLALLVIEQPDGRKVGIAYWFTYGADNETAWFIGIGQAEGNLIDMNLKQASGVGFLEADQPGDDNFVSVGSMVIEFESCNEGLVTFETGIEGVGSGAFPIERITKLYKADCSGGVSDDTEADVMPSEYEIDLYPLDPASPAKGEAEFEERADRTTFEVEVENMEDGTYRIFVGGEERGELLVWMGEGETEFRSPAEEGKVLLTFDPRGQVIEVHDDLGVVLTSEGEEPVTDDDDDDDNDLDDVDFGELEIEIDLANAGVYPEGSAEAELESESDHTEFGVEIEDVPVGDYALHVGGELKGTITVMLKDDGETEGELEFKDPVEPGKLLLDFDPRGQLIEVLEGDTVIFDGVFPE